MFLPKSLLQPFASHHLLNVRLRIFNLHPQRLSWLAGTSIFSQFFHKLQRAKRIIAGKFLDLESVLGKLKQPATFTFHCCFLHRVEEFVKQLCVFTSHNCLLSLAKFLISVGFQRQMQIFYVLHEHRKILFFCLAFLWSDHLW
jgi:hypothetical protein